MEEGEAVTIHSIAAYCQECWRVECRCKRPAKKPVAAIHDDTKSFWSARMGLGEWTTDDQLEVKRRADELLAERLGCTVETLKETKAKLETVG